MLRKETQERARKVCPRTVGKERTRASRREEAKEKAGRETAAECLCSALFRSAKLSKHKTTWIRTVGKNFSVVSSSVEIGEAMREEQIFTQKSVIF